MNKLNVIVPYRNREEHKSLFVEVMYDFLSNCPDFDDFHIYIVEQNDDNEFNRGSLLNIGFLETYAEDNANYYCFNDIDTLPKSSKAIYSRPAIDVISHPYGHLHSLSNFVIVGSETYLKINGFSNKYWTWGYEDDDLLLRAHLNNVKISVDNFTERFKSEIYYELDSNGNNNYEMMEKNNLASTIVNRILFYDSVINPSSLKTEGLNTVDYNLIKKEIHKKYTLLQCRLNNINQNINYINLFKGFTTFVNSITRNTI